MAENNPEKIVSHTHVHIETIHGSVIIGPQIGRGPENTSEQRLQSTRLLETSEALSVAERLRHLPVEQQITFARRQLGFNEAQLRSIQEQETNDMMRVLIALWIQREDENATVGNLSRLLRSLPDGGDRAIEALHP